MSEQSMRRDRRARFLRLPVVASAISFAGILFYLGEYWEGGQVPSPFTTDSSVTHQVDLYLVNPRGLSYDEQGHVSYRFRAEYLQQLQGVDLALATQPVFIGYRQRGDAWTARSEHGEIRQAGEDVTLIDNVVIDNATDGSSLRTTELQLFPQRKYAQTDAEVHLAAPGSVTDGIGLRADLALDRIELLAQVRGRHESQ